MHLEAFFLHFHYMRHFLSKFHVLEYFSPCIDFDSFWKILLYIVLCCQPERKETFPEYIVPCCLSPDLLNCSLSLCLFAIVHFTLICLLDRMSKRRVSFPGLIEQPPLFCKSSIHLIAIMGTSWGWSCVFS